MVAKEGNASFMESMQQPTEMVKEYPFAAMMVVFGTGIALGVVLSHSLGESMSNSYSSGSSGSSNFFSSSQFNSLADRLARQFQDVIHQVLPDSLRR